MVGETADGVALGLTAGTGQGIRAGNNGDRFAAGVMMSAILLRPPLRLAGSKSGGLSIESHRRAVKGGLDRAYYRMHANSQGLAGCH